VISKVIVKVKGIDHIRLIVHMDISFIILLYTPRWCFHLIVVRGFEYARNPESYTSGSVATGRASLAGQVKG
jgi:hypothetical protein